MRIKDSSFLQCLSDDDPLNPDAVDCIRNNWIYDEIQMILDTHSRDIINESSDFFYSTVIYFGIEEIHCDSLLNVTLGELTRQRVIKALMRFEPRISLLSMDIQMENQQELTFLVQANFNHQPLSFLLVWDKVLDAFHLNKRSMIT